MTYADRISQTLFEKFAVEKTQTVFRQLEENPPFMLPWSHYFQLMRIKDKNERKFYEIETTNWARDICLKQGRSVLHSTKIIIKWILCFIIGFYGVMCW